MSESFPPEHAVELCAFEVSGDPKGAGSKDAIPLGRWGKDAKGQRRFFPVCRPSGVPIVNVVDSSGKAGEEWREQVRAACAQALERGHELADGPIVVRVIFYGSSPKGRYGTGRNADELKEHADRLPHQSALPDGTKLARALEDALNGLLWTDDRRVCDLWWSRRFGRYPGARVEVWSVPARFSDVPGERDREQQPGALPLFEGDRDDSSVIIRGDGDHGDTHEVLAG